MSVSRHHTRFRKRYKDPETRTLRSMLSEVAIDAYEARARIAYRGREAADASRDQDVAEQYGVIGLVSRPPEGRGRAVLAHIGGEAARAVVVACKDEDTRTAIIKVAGLDWDEVIVHNSKVIIKVTKDGEVLIGAPGGDFKRVALEGHTHPVPALIGQASYGPAQDSTARTGPPDRVSEDTRVT